MTAVIEKGLLSLNVSETGQLTIKNKQGILFRQRFCPLTGGLRCLFLITSCRAFPNPTRSCKPIWRKLKTGSSSQKLALIFTFPQTIEVASDICKIKTSLTLLRGKPPRNLNLIALSPETLQDSKLLVSGGTMGEIAIKAASELTEGDLSKALLAIQEEGAGAAHLKGCFSLPPGTGLFCPAPSRNGVSAA